MRLGVSGKFVVTQLGYQLNGALLIGGSLAVLKRQIEKNAPAPIYRTVQPIGDRGIGDLSRKCICCEGLRGASEHVARKLVEDEDRCERGFGIARQFGGRATG